MAFIPTPIEEIRASTLDFKQFVLRCLDRMDMVLPACVQAGNYKVIDAKVRLMLASSNFFYDKDEEFKKELASIETKIDNTQSWDYQNYKELMKLISLLSRRKFQKMEVISATAGSTFAGWGDTNDKQAQAAAHLK